LAVSPTSFRKLALPGNVKTAPQSSTTQSILNIIWIGVADDEVAQIAFRPCLDIEGQPPGTAITPEACAPYPVARDKHFSN
jgi:hypothetical protein